MSLFPITVHSITPGGGYHYTHFGGTIIPWIFFVVLPSIYASLYYFCMLLNLLHTWNHTLHILHVLLISFNIDFVRLIHMDACICIYSTNTCIELITCQSLFSACHKQGCNVPNTPIRWRHFPQCTDEQTKIHWG